MQTNSPLNEMQLFQSFLARQIENGDAQLTPEVSVREFRQYQEELERFLQESEEAFAQADRGEAGPIDVDKIMQRVANRIATERNTH